MIERPSPNHDERPVGTPLDMLVLHYTGMESCAGALARLCDDAAAVSAHYLIDEDGMLYALVDEQCRAWHAGISSWRGQSDINARSIGIELVNPGHEFGYRDFPAAQMDTLVSLSRDLLKHHPIPARNVVGHSDVAPARKQDPGERFNWARLAEAGIGLWPGKVLSVDPDAALATVQLAAIGYDVSDMTATLSAFQRRYRPADVSGDFDDETAHLIAAVDTLLITDQS